MGHFERIRHELTFLRRFGRALVGGQQLADVCAVGIMEDALSDRFAPGPVERRVALFRRYLELLDEAATSDTAASSALCSASRKAQWLTVVEEFTPSMAAEVLGVTATEVASFLATYEIEAAHQQPANVMIIEDEALIAFELKRLVRGMGHKAVGVARTAGAALACYHREHPDIVLSDVHLADGSSGIAAVDAISHFQRVPVVFITAFPERFLTGERCEPTFLVNKPFEPSVVRCAISQALYLAEQTRTFSVAEQRAL